MDSMSHSKRAETIKQLGQIDLQIEDLPLILHSKLVKALSDPSAEVRKETVMTLAFLEGEFAIPILEPLLDDPVQFVQSNTIAALSFVGVTPAPDISEKMINFLNSPEPEIRDRCARALGRLKVSQAKEHLLKLAKTDSVPAVRVGAVVGLGMLENGDPQLKLEIRKLLRSETSTPVISTIHETLALIETSILKNEN
jgi:HEAT repeat protein